MGAGHSAFANTQWTKILAIATMNPSGMEQMLAELASSYWRPVYKFIRISWHKSNDDAKDLTQEFFASVFHPEFLRRADPARGSFRSFLLACLKNFLRDRRKYEGGLKRGGSAVFIPLQDVSEEAPISLDADPEEEFKRSWAEQLLQESLEELRQSLAARGRECVFRVFQEYCLQTTPGEEVSYRSIGQKTGLSTGEVTNYLFEARRELRRILEAKVGRTVASPQAAQEELRALFGT